MATCWREPLWQTDGFVFALVEKRDPIAGSSIKRSLLAGPRLIQSHPGIFIVWIVVELARGLIEAQLVSITPGGPTSPERLALFRATFIEIGFALSLPLEAAMWAAAFRAFLRPGEVRFAYLRFGATELRLTGLVLLLDMAQAIFTGLPLAGFMLQHSTFRLPIWLSILADLWSLVGALALVRFLLAPAILIDQNHVSLRDSWRLTRANFWSIAIPLLAWQVLSMVVGWLVVLMVHAVSDIAAARKLNWLVLTYSHGAAATNFSTWLSITRLVLMTSTAVLEALSFAVIAGIVTTAYQHVTANAGALCQDQPV